MPPPKFAAKNNTNYGGTLINQKYSPLQNITLVDGDKSSIQKLFNDRITLLKNWFPKKLSLVSSNWPEIGINKDIPPMVVISSKRAEWMKTLFNNANKKNAAAPITGYLDKKTFNEGVIPWYSPLRSGRPVYIVVYHTEYAYYKKQLAAFQNVYVIGWGLPPKDKSKDSFGLVGFGASRFAALQLVKTVGFHRAWTVDDNVVNINGFPNTLAEIEGLISDGKTAAVGFEATTRNLTEGEVWTASKFEEKDFVFAEQAAGLLQQVVLWNLDLLGENLNFSPYFVSSNEDVSLTNYLKAFNFTEKVIDGLSIIKMGPVDDKNNKGEATLDTFRKALLELLYNKEKDVLIQVDSAAPVALETFVPDPLIKKSLDKDAKVPKTQSMAIEQVLALAVSNKWAPLNTFNPYNGFAGTKVERLIG